MPSPGSRSAARVVLVAGALATLLMAVLAARSDNQAADGNAASTARDVGVGLAFGLAALAATGPQRQRVLMGAVGLAWLAGSVFQAALSLHQAVLIIVLLATPTGSVRGRPQLALALLASLLIAGEVLPQPAVAGTFLAVAAVVWVSSDRWEVSVVFACCAGIVVALVLAFGWWVVPRGTSASTVLSVYEATLALLAVGFATATRADAKARAALADRVLGSRTVAGLEGLRQVLAGALHDTDLEVELADQPEATSSRGGAAVDSRWTSLPVYEGEAVVAVVRTRSAALADGPTARAVATAVRLTVANLRLDRAQADQAVEVEESRVRLVAAVDRERQRIAGRLRDGAGVHLERALAGFAADNGHDAAGRSELECLVESEIAAASDEVERIVVGVPPAELGSGRLKSAITALADRSPVPVDLELADDATADAAIETALFYVCSEALTNMARHSGASAATIWLHRRPAEIVLVIRDNGHGGADAGGSGLRGLRDRMATLGGRVDISSPAEGGTVVAAVVPTRGP